MSLIALSIIISTLVIVIIATPFFVIAAVVVLIVFVLIQWLTAPANKVLKTLTGESNSKVYASVNESLSGLAVIRAFDSSKRIFSKNLSLIDRNHTALFYLIHARVYISRSCDVYDYLTQLGGTLSILISWAP